MALEFDNGEEHLDDKNADRGDSYAYASDQSSETRSQQGSDRGHCLGQTLGMNGTPFCFRLKFSF